MTIDEPTRYELSAWFAQHMPPKVAEAMMRSIPPTGWGDIATRNDLTANAIMVRGEMAEVRGEMAEVRGEMAEVRGEMAEVRGEIALLRADFEGFRAETRAEFAAIRAEMALMQSQTNRTIIIAAVATAVSSWGAAFATLGLA